MNVDTARARTAIVTGGASGIGLAIARRLAREGASIAIFDIDGEAAAAAAASIEATGGRARGYPVDVTDRAAIDTGVERTRDELGRPTILVNNAGMTPASPFLDLSFETWSRSISINLDSVFHCCQAVLPAMLEEGWGRIVNISSSSVHSGSPRLGAYVSAKSGVVGLTKVLALEFGPRGITVNTIPPGFIDTPMLRDAEKNGVMNVEQQTARTPVGRIGQPEDIAAACAFLVRDEAGYITGQVFGVNGGRNT
ncbi:NAD(P)-dependent dehydrogenase, short-chain alcohol dehydrogenase family [Parafrankia irregularis]|uniref:NAD(P)-dependent dehydrogenase, short-chain alcohol dehydrogenase family n=1 Tax=Parafrankia irregularis TaxID=795642 RepID=A0A0S4QHW3_9ACTN|nr:SDR family NAD(P)-dependent oxidoreductase [Parafrankia irregularis]CUU54674.1 NAD(P)-dependent dehydrogenase, short-chain alcohol dehydrogenase family [Parafrankia irregularis]